MQGYTDAEIMRFNHYSRVAYIEARLFGIYKGLSEGSISRDRFDSERKRWNALWESVRPTIPEDTNARVDDTESALELCNEVNLDLWD